MRFSDMLAVLACLVGAASAQLQSNKPNILFVVVESTDAKAYFGPFNSPGVEPPMDLPFLNGMMNDGVSLTQHYVTAPVCCPSRATLWSGRNTHQIPHKQAGTGIDVQGAWNNYEGLPSGYNMTFEDLLSDAGYSVGVFGKRDYNTGGHSVDARVTAWTNKVKFPGQDTFNQDGWYDESGPNAHTVTGNHTHQNDWNNVAKLSDFIMNQTAAGKPWIGFAGLDIVHPDYDSSTYWVSKINQSRVTIPHWIDEKDMHPEDFASTMKKKMAGPWVDNDDKKKGIRTNYYATIAEYDSMLGTLLDVVNKAGIRDNTYVIATSDHGDMNMEHRQFYKMVFYDPSTRVPMIMTGPNIPKGKVITNLTSHLDMFPTLFDMAKVPIPAASKATGRSLLPLITTGSDPGRPDFVVSQFHGDNIHLSWFMIRQGPYKYVTYGSGKEVAPRLFNMEEDPLEMNDLASEDRTTVARLDALLRDFLNYPAIAEDVESYNKESFALWRQGEGDKYNQSMEHIRWDWQNSAFAAVDEWLTTPNSTFEWAFDGTQPRP